MQHFYLCEFEKNSKRLVECLVVTELSLSRKVCILSLIFIKDFKTVGFTMVFQFSYLLLSVLLEIHLQDWKLTVST